MPNTSGESFARQIRVTAGNDNGDGIASLKSVDRLSDSVFGVAPASSASSMRWGRPHFEVNAKGPALTSSSRKDGSLDSRCGRRRHRPVQRCGERLVGRRTVRAPAGVADTDRPRERPVRQCLAQVGNFPGVFAQVEPVFATPPSGRFPTVLPRFESREQRVWDARAAADTAESHTQRTTSAPSRTVPLTVTPVASRALGPTSDPETKLTSPSATARSAMTAPSRWTRET